MIKKPGSGNVIKLHGPKIDGNKLHLAWDDTELFDEAGFWIEYQGLDGALSHTNKLQEAYLPVCIALALLGDITLKLPLPMYRAVLDRWEDVCSSTARVMGRKSSVVKILAPGITPEEKREGTPDKTALLFGGGSESLLTLGRLMDKGIRPYLISCWGRSWLGSDPEVNLKRYELEQELSREFGLRILRVNTNVRSIFHKKNFKPFLKRKVYITNAALFLPIVLSSVLPVTRSLGIKLIVCGHEKECHKGFKSYSFSADMTAKLRLPGEDVQYRSCLSDLTKVRIISELHERYPKIAKYQYSCFNSNTGRWCMECEKCLRNYISIKLCGADPGVVGLDEERIMGNLSSILNKTKRRDYSKPLFAAWENIISRAKVSGQDDMAQIAGKMTGWPLFARSLKRQLFWWYREEGP